MTKYMKKNKEDEWDQKLTRVMEKAFTHEVMSSKTYEYLKGGYSSQKCKVTTVGLCMKYMGMRCVQNSEQGRRQQQGKQRVSQRKLHVGPYRLLYKN